MALNPQEKIKEFDDFRVEDAQPTIEALSDYVCYETGSFSNPLNFADRDGFPTRFSKEAEHIAKMNEILEAGEYFVHSVYTYRSIHRALPNVKPNEEKKAEMYRKMFEVLQPEIKKIRDLLMFFNEAVELLAHIVLDLVSQEKKKEIPSDTVLDYVARVLDMFLKLDSLKNMKAALSNDFASYKRAIPFMDLAGLDTQAAAIDVKSDDNIKLYDFLSKSGFILKGLKDCLAKVASFEDIIILVINRCADNFESGRFVFCDEKHANLRVCALGLYLIDNNSKTNHLKKLDSLTNLYKHFKRYPCIPLYGDMTFTLKSVLKQCPNLNEAEWALQLRDEQKLEQQILLVNQVPTIRNSFVNFVTTFTFCTNKIRNLVKNNKEVPDNLREEVKTLSEQGIQMISDWTCKVLEQSAWKYAHPAALSKLESEANGSEEKQEEKPTTPSTPASTTTENGEGATEKKQEVSDYERVVRFNYSAEERTALVDIISMIKGVEAIMSKNTGLIAPLLKGQIFFELQTFCKSTLYDMLVRTKTKKRTIHTVVLEMRNIAENWLDKPPVEIKKRSKKDPIPEFPKRKVGPSFTQLHMIRSILSVLYSDRSPGMQKKGLLGEKDFSESQVKAMRAFYNQSFYWTYLLNYNATLKKATDLASLWYREFYLEISKRIQFPIEMSLPWILAEDIIEKRNTTLMESIIYPLALYNDAAHRALFVLKRKFLYDEIEAEVNLVFDQMVYKLSEQIYQYFKIVSSNMLLDNKFRSGIEKIQRITRWHVPKSRYDVLLSQKHINLLGRQVDLNFLITQRTNKNIKENILKAIQKFESLSLNHIIEFESLLDTIRMTHKLLSFHLDLDPFETLLAEVNESLSAVSFEGRIARHVCEELIYDLFPANVFNSVTQRFISGPVVYSDGDTDYQREKAPRIPPQYLYGTKGFINSYAHVHDQYQSYFGEEHVRSLIRIVGIDSLAVIVESCVTYMEEKIYSEMSPYVEALMEAIPPQVKLQPAAYGLYGVFSYFKVTFRDFLDYEMLKPGVFQSFKVIGNCLCFLMMLDTLVGQKSVSQYIAAAPFIGIKPLARKDKDNRNTMSASVGEGDETIPDIFVRTDQLETTPLLTRINLLVSNPELQGILRSKSQATELPKTAMRAVKLYNPPRGPTSLFKQVLERCTTILNNVREQWKGTSPPDRLQKLDSSKEFYRLWGILQFIFCMKQQAKNTDFEIFGDGFFWGGCSIVYLFGQQLRFDAFNFTDHVLNVHTLTVNQQQPAQKTKGKEGQQIDPEIQEFLVNANEIRILNNRIYNTLKVHFPMAYSQIERFAAPESEDFTKVKIVAKVEKPAENRSRTLSTVSSFSELNRSTLSTFGTSPNLSSAPVSTPGSPALSAPAPPSMAPPPPPPMSAPPAPPAPMSAPPPPPPPMSAPRPPAPPAPPTSAPPMMSGGPPPPPPPPPPPMKQ